MKTILILAVLSAASLYAVGVGLLAWQQRRLLYVPDTTVPAIAAVEVAKARVLTVRTIDGLDLLAWWVPPADDTEPVVLYLHGNGGNIGYRTARFAQISRFGWGALLMEYRGFGGNPGAPSESGLTLDARAAYDALRGLGIPSHRIVIWGESLGTGLAVRLATEVKVGAVLLESPYTSIAAVAKQKYPFVPVDWLLRDRFELLDRVSAVVAPVLVMTGGRDLVVPPAMGQAVFAATNAPKHFWFAPDAGHNDLVVAGAFDAMQTFMGEYWRRGQ